MKETFKILSYILTIIFVIGSMVFEYKEDYQKANNYMLWAIFMSIGLLQ